MQRRTLARALMSACLLTLAGCAQGNNRADLQPAAQQTASPAQPAPAAPAPRQVALTPEKIKADCWMKYEGDKKVKNIDDRLKLVEKCVDETSRNQPPQR